MSFAKCKEGRTRLELDAVDYRILVSLQKDSRMAIKDVAREANVSLPTARTRIKRLIEIGVIKQFTTILDQEKLFGGVTALISLKCEVPDLKNVGGEIKQMDEVSDAYFTTGEHNLTVKVSVPDLKALDEFVTTKLGAVQGLKYVRSDMVTGTIKEHYDTPLRPGYGVRIPCQTCKKDIRGDMVKMNIGGHEFYFCCTSCAGLFKKERESLVS